MEVVGGGRRPPDHRRDPAARLDSGGSAVEGGEKLSKTAVAESRGGRGDCAAVGTLQIEASQRLAR